MRILISQTSKVILAVCALAAAANSATVPAGTVNFNLTGLPGTATVDIFNQTGPNSTAFPDTTWPVSTSISLSSLGLTLNFVGGTSQVFGPSYFTLAGDGLSFNGATISISTAVNSAVLSGSFNPTTWTLNDGSTFTASPHFTATINDTSGTLADGDFALIVGTSGNPVVPEPGTWLMVGAGLAGLLLIRFARQRTIQRVLLTVVAACCVSSFSTFAAPAVKLNTWTGPSTGISGTSLVWVTASGFPTGTIKPTDVTLAVETSCGVATGETATAALKVIPVTGTSEKIQFQVPSGLKKANYFVTLSGTTTGGAAFVSSNCSEIAVTTSNVAVGSCNPGSSMGMLVPAAGTGSTTVTAYVPNSNWGDVATGIRVVRVEGAGSPLSVPTVEFINSCSTDSSTGITACTANGSTAHVHLVTGNAVTKTVTTASNTKLGFSGGSCFNCGVAVNAVTHQAVITMGHTGSTAALQFLDLSSGALGSVVPSTHNVSEDVLWDPFRNLVLSPVESSGTYDLFRTPGTGLPGTSTVTEFANNSLPRAFYDSAGEDCTTGIALATVEGTSSLFIADLSKATFTPGTPGTWTAPSQTQNFPEFAGLAAGTSAIAIAPGSSHEGVVAGEFGGDTVGVILLPSKSGTGTPSVVDYAYATLPNTPDSFGFSNGFDPHTTTAYTSPNNGKAYGVLASWASGAPLYLGIIDIDAMLKAPRSTGHTVDPTYDLLAHGVVRYVKTQ